MYKCKKCGREYKRKCDRTRHQNKCGDIYLHNGYECFIDDKGNEVFVHRDIIEKQLGRKLETNEDVHHKDENKRNNDPSNLEVIHKADHTSEHWKRDSISRRQNMSKSKRKNWQNIHGVKLSPEKVIEIRNRLNNKEKQKDLADEYGVSHHTIKDIRCRNTWKNI